MIPTDSPLYQKAFERYLRKGTPVEVSIKAWQSTQDHLTPRYMWMTAGDEKVRASHAANDGKVFSWDNPPPTGNPGEEINCRCVAVPYIDPVDVARFEFGAFFAITPANRARVLGSVVLRAAVRRIFRREDAPAEKLAEPTPLPKPEGVPKNWEQSVSNNSKGIRYRDPNNKHNEVRVQRGDPNSPNAAQRVDYVKWKKHGQYLDKYGKQVSGDSPEAHIPIEEFKFDWGLFK